MQINAECVTFCVFSIVYRPISASGNINNLYVVAIYCWTVYYKKIKSIKDNEIIQFGSNFNGSLDWTCYTFKNIRQMKNHSDYYKQILKR